MKGHTVHIQFALLHVDILTPQQRPFVIFRSRTGLQSANRRGGGGTPPPQQNTLPCFLVVVVALTTILTMWTYFSDRVCRQRPPRLIQSSSSTVTRLALKTTKKVLYKKKGGRHYQKVGSEVVVPAPVVPCHGVEKSSSWKSNQSSKTKIIVKSLVY